MKSEFGRKLSCLAFTLATTTMMGSGMANATPVYNVTDLTALGGVGPMVSGINDYGQVVGDNYIYDSASGSFSVIDISGFAHTQAKQINNVGQVTGVTNVTGAGFISDPATHTITGLGTLAGGTFNSGQDINDNGQVVGFANVPSNIPSNPSYNDHAFVSNPDTNNIYDLGTLGTGLESRATAINNNGVVVGYSSTWFAFIEHAFVSQTHINPATGRVSGSLFDLGSLGRYSSSSSVASDINNNGAIVGSTDTYFGQTHAFIADNSSGIVSWGAYTMTDIGSLFGESSASAINDNRQVVGDTWGTTSSGSHQNETGFLWDAGTMYDINNLIDVNDPLFGNFTLKIATDINSYGDIIGTSTAGHAILLTAQRASGNTGNIVLAGNTTSSVPEPAPLALLGLGLMGFGVMRKRRG